MNRLALTLILFGAVVLTASNAIVKVAGLKDLTLWEISLARFSISMLVYLPFFLRERVELRRLGNPLLFFRGFIGFLAILFNYYAAMTISLGNATLLNLTSPLFTFVLAPFLLGEKLEKKKFAWLLVAVVGVLLVTPFHVQSAAMGGYLTGLASGLCAASAYMTIRKLHEKESFITISFTYSVIATALCLMGSLFGTVRPEALSRSWKVLLAVGLLGTLYQGLYTLALRFEKASRLAPFLYLSVVSSFLWGFFQFGETITALNAVGAVLVIVALALLGR